jgi:hypothetical protein
MDLCLECGRELLPRETTEYAGLRFVCTVKSILPRSHRELRKWVFAGSAAVLIFALVWMRIRARHIF